MLHERCLVLVDTEPNNAHLFAPVITPLLEHFLVMGHGTLARWAPSGPKIEEDDLTGLVLNINLVVGP